MQRPLVIIGLVVVGGVLLLSTCVRVHVHVEVPTWAGGQSPASEASASEVAAPAPAAAPAPVAAPPPPPPRTPPLPAGEGAREDAREAALRQARREAEARAQRKRQEQVDALLQTALRISGDIQAWALKPRAFGGGDGNVARASFPWLGYPTDSVGAFRTLDGSFRLDADSAAVRVVGEAEGLSDRVVVTVSGIGAEHIEAAVEPR